MKKIVIVSIFLISLTQTCYAEPTAVPTCACNDISKQLKLDKKVEAQTKQEIKKMDIEAENLDNTASHTSDKNMKKKSFWNFAK